MDSTVYHSQRYKAGKCNNISTTDALHIYEVNANVYTIKVYPYTQSYTSNYGYADDTFKTLADFLMYKDHIFIIEIQ